MIDNGTRAAGRVLTPHEAAERLSIRPRTLESWRQRGLGPPVTFVGRLARYREADIEAWLSGRRVEFEPEQGPARSRTRLP